MTGLADVIRNARLSAKLDRRLMASRVGLDEAQVRLLEEGAVEPGPDELDAYAQVFGLRMREAAKGEAMGAPLTHLFFRAMSEGGLAGLKELIASEAQWPIVERRLDLSALQKAATNR